MTMIIAVRMVRFSFGLILFWVLFYISTRSLLLDILRQRLFEIRDDLFDFAADGGIEFTNPVYCELRVDINNMIRFAHKLSFARMILAQLQISDDDPAMTSFRSWVERANQLQPLARRKVFDVRTKVLHEVVVYIVRRSIVAFIFISTLRFIGLFWDAMRNFVGKLPQFAESLEAQARDEYRSAA
jgi:hypothetical protein